MPIWRPEATQHTPLHPITIPHPSKWETCAPTAQGGRQGPERVDGSASSHLGRTPSSLYWSARGG